MTSRAFNQETGAAARAAKEGPVFITNRGEPSLVLLSMAEYRRLTEKAPSALDLFGMPPDEYVDDFEAARMGDWGSRDVDLS